MNLIILPGNDWRNQVWTEEIEQLVKEDFEKTWVQHYDNWGTHTLLLDPEMEMKNLAQKAQDFGEFVIFAKSAGTLLAMKAVTEGKIKPVKCMFVGTAIRWGMTQGWPVESWVKGYNLPTLFIQKKDDPIMRFADLKQELEKLEVKNYKLVEIPGDSHHYEKVFELKKMLKELTVNKEYEGIG